MPRQLIKDRAFQEPIHEDAPGFNANQGHRNLITELNKIVLPSYVTDLIGLADATPEQYQFRVNADDQLEYYFGGAWRLLRLGTGGGTAGKYAPKYKADFSVNSSEAKNAWCMLDITTELSAHYYDMRVYQDGTPRLTKVSVVSYDEATRKTTYNIQFEAVLGLGDTFLELRYGDPECDYQGVVPVKLVTTDRDHLHTGSGSGGTLTLISGEQTSNLRHLVPNVSAASDLASWTSLNITNDDAPGVSESTSSEFTFINPATGSKHTPWLGVAHFNTAEPVYTGDIRSRLIPGKSNLISFYRSDADWYVQAVYRKKLGDFYFYCIQHGSYSTNHSQFYDFVGVSNSRRMLLYGTYENGGSTFSPTYRLPDGTLYENNLGAVAFGQPFHLFAIYSIPMGSVIEQDIPL